MRSLLLLSVFFFSACEKTDIEYDKAFKKSNAAWQSFKSSNNNTYRFTVSGGTWAGSGWETTVTVQRGLTVKRVFRYTGYNNFRMPLTGWDETSISMFLESLNITREQFYESAQEMPEAVLFWEEDAAQIGSHKNTPASPFLNLDEVYEKAKNDWLKKQNGVSTFFETKHNGMISSCGYVPDGCQDDCFVGINISLIEAL